MGTTLWWMRTKRTTTKRMFDPFFECLKNLLSPFGYVNYMRRIISLSAVIWMSVGILTPGVAGSSKAQADSHVHDFVIFVTVFTERGFALPGARVRVRRADEQKFRWEAVSDRQGELGIRVKQGGQYEMTIEARGFKPQTRKMDAGEGDREDVTLQMEPLAGGKP